MATSNQTKQTRILYLCFIALLIAAAIVAAVAGGLKKSSPDGVRIAPAETDGKAPEETEGGKQTGNFPPRGPVGTSGESDGGAASEPESEPETEPTALEPEPVTFVVPVNGLLYAEFSDTTPVFSPTMNDFRTHNGVDVEAAEGDPVFACADGVIEEVWSDPMMGRSIRISHGDGYESVYRNLADELPAGIVKGAGVKAGQTVGAVGTTALIECEDEPHLHFELRLAGKNVDPTERIVFRLADEEFEG